MKLQDILKSESDWLQNSAKSPKFFEGDRCCLEGALLKSTDPDSSDYDLKLNLMTDIINRRATTPVTCPSQYNEYCSWSDVQEICKTFDEEWPQYLGRLELNINKD